jgi:hypothetical protein
MYWLFGVIKTTAGLQPPAASGKQPGAMGQRAMAKAEPALPCAARKNSEFNQCNSAESAVANCWILHCCALLLPLQGVLQEAVRPVNSCCLDGLGCFSCFAAARQGMQVQHRTFSCRQAGAAAVCNVAEILQLSAAWLTHV